jgi:hypothetical protein
VSGLAAARAETCRHSKDGLTLPKPEERVIGDALRARTDRHRMTEVAIAAHVLNRMFEFGRPKSVRIA